LDYEVARRACHQLWRIGELHRLTPGRAGHSSSPPLYTSVPFPS
jgi:hypothetical protein